MISLKCEHRHQITITFTPNLSFIKMRNHSIICVMLASYSKPDLKGHFNKGTSSHNSILSLLMLRNLTLPTESVFGVRILHMLTDSARSASGVQIEGTTFVAKKAAYAEVNEERSEPLCGELRNLSRRVTFTFFWILKCPLKTGLTVYKLDCSVARNRKCIPRSP